MKRWNKVKGVLALELCDVNGDTFTADGIALPPLDWRVAGVKYAELIITFESSGYYDHGCMYRPNGDPGYPPEGEDERLLVEMEFLCDGKRLDITPDRQEEIFELLADQIAAVDIDTDEY